MNLRLSIDRFEGRKKEIAVLLTDDGTQINFPKRLLPKGVKAGAILCFEIESEAGNAELEPFATGCGVGGSQEVLERDHPVP